MNSGAGDETIQSLVLSCDVGDQVVKLLCLGQLDSVVMDAGACAFAGELLGDDKIFVRFWQAVETV